MRLVALDGEATDDMGWRWQRQGYWFGPPLWSGEVAVSGPSGVYAADLVTGAARLVARGELVSGGLHHVAVVTCDELFECRNELVDVRTGEAVVLGGVARARFQRAGMRVSPDGRWLYQEPDQSGPATLVEVASGAVVELGVDMWIGAVEMWAPDSSGIFAVGADGLVFYGIEGLRVDLSEFGRVTTVGVVTPQGAGP